MAREEKAEKTIKKILGLVEKFNLDELLDLRFELQERIEHLTERERETTQTKEPTITKREEWRKCGKANCRCQTEGELHGPYVYEYWKENGKTKSRYIGKG